MFVVAHSSPTVAVATLGVVGAVIAGVLGGLAWRRRDRMGAVPFAVMMLACAGWLVTFSLQVLSTDLDGAVFWYTVSRSVLAVVVPVAWVWFCLQFAGVGPRVERWQYALLALPGVLGGVAILTNAQTGLVWSSPRLVTEGGVSLLAVTFEPGFWVLNVGVYAVIAVGFWALVTRLTDASRVYRRQFQLILLAGIAPSVGNVLYVARMGPLPHLDFTPFGFVLEGVLVFVAVFRYGLLDLAPIARSAVVEEMDDGLIVVDDRDRVVDCNPTAVALASSDDPVGDTLGVAFPLVTGTATRETGDDRSVTDGGATAVVETTVGATVDGADRYFDPRVTAITDHHGLRVGRVVLLRDVTSRERRERTLAALREISRELTLAASPEAVAELAVTALQEELDVTSASLYRYEAGDGTTDGRLVPVAVTDQVREFYETLPEYSVDEGLFGAAYGADEPLVYRDVHAADVDLSDEDAPIRGAILIPLGEFGVLAAATAAPLDLDGGLVDFATILAANTEAALERADREATLRARERELERQNERLDEFASVVSHDLRNPISVAQGWLELAREEDDFDALDDVAAALDRMEELTDDLLTLARSGDAVDDPEPVAIAAVARDAWRTVDTGESELVSRIEDDAADGAVTLLADASRLRQVFENLFRNAIEHGGARRVTLTTTGDGFAVADDGEGIPQADRDQVFERGYATGDGTGFGLAIVADVAAAHGWDVTVGESDEGGARFAVTGVEWVRSATADD